MDYKRREEIFAKEVLRISDIMEMMDCSNATACNLINEWKRKLQFNGKTLRVDLAGRIHILDYFDIMGIDLEHPGDRYIKKKQYDVYDEINTYDEETQKRLYERS